MVARTFSAMDSAALTVVSAPSSSNQSPGEAITNESDSPDGTVYEFQAGFSTQSIMLEDTGGDADTFEDDDTGGHTITDGAGMVANGTGVEAESIFYLRALDEFGNETGPEIQVSVFSQNGQTSDIWGFSTSLPLEVSTQYVKVGGSVTGSSGYDTFVPCFVAGTLIRTDRGYKRVEDLQSGDLIWTHGSGYQPVTLVLCTTTTGTGRFAPVRISAGLLGATRDLWVSPQHRMLIAGAATDLLFGETEVLVPAIGLTGLQGVDQIERARVSYVHLVFEEHFIVEADGSLTESFYPGATALDAMEEATRAEILAIFPDLLEQTAPAVAAPLLSGADTRSLCTLLTEPVSLAIERVEP